MLLAEAELDMAAHHRGVPDLTAEYGMEDDSDSDDDDDETTELQPQRKRRRDSRAAQAMNATRRRRLVAQQLWDHRQSKRAVPV